jgi:hypothetical protein
MTDWIWRVFESKREVALTAEAVLAAAEEIASRPLSSAGRELVLACCRAAVASTRRLEPVLRALADRGVLQGTPVFGGVVYHLSDRLGERLEELFEEAFRRVDENGAAQLWVVTARHRDLDRVRRWIAIASSEEQAIDRLGAALRAVGDDAGAHGDWRARRASAPAVEVGAGGDVPVGGLA